MYQPQQPTTSMSAQNMLVQTVADQQPQYTEEFYQAHSGEDLADLTASEHYIYVSYPPELRKKLLDRYGKDLYLLLKKDMYDY
jgi:hypothetical protein